MEQDNLLNLKVPPYNILTSYKGENSNFTGETSGKQHYNQVIKVNITKTSAIQG